MGTTDLEREELDRFHGGSNSFKNDYVWSIVDTVWESIVNVDKVQESEIKGKMGNYGKYLAKMIKWSQIWISIRTFAKIWESIWKCEYVVDKGCLSKYFLPKLVGPLEVIYLFHFVWVFLWITYYYIAM